MEGSPASHTQGSHTLTSFPEMHPGEVVKGAELSIKDLPSHCHTSMHLWGGLGGPECCFIYWNIEIILI